MKISKMLHLSNFNDDKSFIEVNEIQAALKNSLKVCGSNTLKEKAKHQIPIKIGQSLLITIIKQFIINSIDNV